MANQGQKGQGPDKLTALYQLLAACWHIGPYLLYQANVLVARTIYRGGFVKSQAVATVFLIDAKKIHEVAVITVCLVALDFKTLVSEIVVAAVEKLDRSDAMSETTMELMNMQELWAVTEVNNELVANGHMSVGAQITGALGNKVTSGAFEALKNTGNFLSGLWPFHDKGKEKAHDNGGPAVTPAHREIESEDVGAALDDLDLVRGQSQGSQK